MTPFIIAVVMVLSFSTHAGAAESPDAVLIGKLDAQLIALDKIDKKLEMRRRRLDSQPKNANPTAIAELKKETSDLEKERRAAGTRAIHLAIKAYGLEPENSKGTSVYGYSKGREVHWIPIYEEPDEREVENAGGNRKKIRPPTTDPGLRVPMVSGRNVMGSTYTDGVTVMYPEAFKHGPGFLASFILHERIHFEQITTAGRADRLTAAELDREAYQAQKQTLSRFGLDGHSTNDGLTKFASQLPAVLDDTISSLDASIASDRKAKNGFIMGRLYRLRDKYFPVADLDVFESRVHSEEELRVIRERSDQLKTEIESEIAGFTRESDSSVVVRDAASFAVPAEPLFGDPFGRGSRPPKREPLFALEPVGPSPRPRNVNPISARSVLPDLRELARFACESPAGITQDYLNSSFPSIASGEPFGAESAGTLTGCARTLFLELAEYNMNGVRGGGLSATWLIDRAQALSPRSPAVPPSSNQSSSRRSPGSDDPCVFWDPHFGGWVRRVPCQ